MGFELTILGSNSAKPCYGRFTTAQYLKTGNDAFLIDAGEAVQIQLLKFGLKANKISKIFISHLHGDHILGLPGLLTSLSLNSRSAPLELFAPKGLRKWIDTFVEISGSYISYPITYVELESKRCKVITTTKDCTVSAFPVVHRVPTYGFLFQEKRAFHNMDSKKIKEFNLTIPEIKLAKQGEDIIRRGETIKNKDVVLPKVAPVSYGFCADTVYTDAFLNSIANIDLLYHEATYLHELNDLAIERMHSTAKQAGQIALAAGVKKLIIGHYSSRYKDLSPLLEEAKTIFSNTHLALEGDCHRI